MMPKVCIKQTRNKAMITVNCQMAFWQVSCFSEEMRKTKYFNHISCLRDAIRIKDLWNTKYWRRLLTFLMIQKVCNYPVWEYGRPKALKCPIIWNPPGINPSHFQDIEFNCYPPPPQVHVPFKLDVSKYILYNFTKCFSFYLKSYTAISFSIHKRTFGRPTIWRKYSRKILKWILGK